MVSLAFCSAVTPPKRSLEITTAGFTGQAPFLLPNQQCQCTEWNWF